MKVASFNRIKLGISTKTVSAHMIEILVHEGLSILHTEANLIRGTIVE